MLNFTEDNLEEYLFSLPRETFDNENKILDICKKIKELNLESDWAKNREFNKLFELVSSRLCHNKNYAIELINFNSKFSKYIDYKLLMDKDVILAIAKNNGYPEFNYQENFEDVGFLMEVIKYIPSYIRFAQIQHLYNINLIKEIVRDYPKVIPFIPYHFQTKKEILDIALLNEVDLSFIDNNYIHKNYVIDYFLKNTKDWRLIQISLNIKDIEKIKLSSICPIIVKEAERIFQENKLKKEKFLSKDEYHFSDDEFELLQLNNDYEFMFKVIEKCGYGYLEYASSNLLNNKKFIQEISKFFINEHSLWGKLPVNMQLDIDMIKLCNQIGYKIDDIIDSIIKAKANKKIAYLFNVQLLIDSIFKEKSIALLAFKNNNLDYFEKIHFSLREDKEIICCYLENITDVSEIEQIYKLIPENLKFEPEIVFHTLKMMKRISFAFDEQYIKNLPIKLKNNSKIIKEILQIDGIYLKYLPKEIRINKEFIKKAIDNNPKAIKYTSFKSRFLNFFGINT